MSKFSAEAKVGFFVLVGILILGYMSMKVGKLGFTSNEGYPVRVYFDSAAGLARDVPVEVAGVEVGRVQDIVLENGKALVTLRINPKVKITRDVKAMIRTRGILGDKYVDLIPGSPSAPPLKPGGQIVNTTPTTDMDTLMNALADVARDIKALTGALSSVLGGEEGKASMRAIVQNLREMVEALNQTVQKNNTDIASIITNLADFSGKLKQIGDANTEDIRLIVKNVRGASDSLEGLITSMNQISEKISKGEGSLGRLVNDQSTIDNLNATLASLREISDKVNRGKGTLGRLVSDEDTITKLDTSLGSFQEITNKINKGEGTLGRLVNDEETVENLNSTLTGINDYIQKQEMFRTSVDYHGEYLLDSEGVKSYLSLKLQPKYDKYYLVQIVDSPEGRDKVTDTTWTIDGVTHQQHTVTNEKDDLLFSVQIAKRYYDLNLRGGLFESTGGAAIDYYLFKDRLTLSLEAFDFDPDRNPHLKFKADFTPFKHIYLTTGIDDFISDEGKDSVFVGAGINFSDEDIKALLTSVPLP